MKNAPLYRNAGSAILLAWMLLLGLVLTTAIPDTASAQSLNWEGQTGVLITPMAYTAPSGNGFGRPVVAYHYLSAGDVLGGFHQASVTVGLFKRAELGYTRNLHGDGSTPGLSSLWTGGFNIFHGKANFVTEGRKLVPAVSIGFVARSQIRNVSGVIQNKNTSNADFYIVGTKTLTQIRRLPLVFNLGLKGTNASVLGLAGNAPDYQARLFGAGAFALRGPRGSTILLGSEFLQQSRAVQGVPGVAIPTTITYAVRIVPAGALPLGGWSVEDAPRLTIDFGIAQVAGNVAPGVNLNARHQFGLGISYGF